MIRPFSYSQISTYLECPLRYKLRYVDRLPTKPRPYFSFGATLHRCLVYYFGKRRKQPPALAKWLGFYRQTWTSAGYRSPEEEERYKAAGQDILTTFWQRHAVPFHQPLATESRFLVEIGGVPLLGFIDRVDLSPQGGLVIMDYKSSQNPPSMREVQSDLQLSLYQMACQRTWLLPVEALAIYHLRTNKTVGSEPRSAAQLRETEATVREVVHAIARGAFPARRSHFCPCDYPEFCPYFPSTSSFDKLRAPPLGLSAGGLTAPSVGPDHNK